MANYEYVIGDVICSEHTPISEILMITNGSVETTINGKTFTYTHGDVPGIWDLSSGIYSGTYTATSDVKITTYPYKNLSALETLLQAKPLVAYLLVCTACRQISTLLQYVFKLRSDAGHAYESALDLYEHYVEMCTTYAVTAKKLALVDDTPPLSEENPLDEWIYTYYSEIRGLDQALHKSFFGENAGIALGFIRKAAEDSYRALNACRSYYEYLTGISPIFLNNDGQDLFAYISELHISSVNIRGADEAIGTAMERLIRQIDVLPGIDMGSFENREEEYADMLQSRRSSQAETDAPVSTQGDAVIKQNLVGSMNVILEYSGCSTETSSMFVRNVQEFTELSDKTESSDDTRRLRRELTQTFYELYQSVLIKSLGDPSPPTIINMFLNFGYVDAALTGANNADFLYSIADSFKGDPQRGVYSLREWMLAVYNGKKEPSKSELDEDYSDKINELKKSKKINDKEASEMMADQAAKLRFELENVFPVANKVTSGTVSTFVPVMSSHTIMRPLEDVMATADSINKTIDEIRAVDFTAYYRELRFETKVGTIQNVERIQVEVLPDIILMPNSGTRGIMWQEIIGRDRRTKARMFMPMFLQSELKATMIRLTADFRWEMCKRIQGSRWSDVTNPCLTSEVCDYLQFYRTNRELSLEDINMIRNELSSARNNFKTVFTTYYSVWVLFESRGLARFNKILRRILLTYCPFPQQIRGAVSKNPQFTEAINRYNNKQAQRAKLLSNLIQKIEKTGKPAPQELRDELEFAYR